MKVGEDKVKYAFYISGQSGRLFKYLQQAEKKQIEEIGLVISDKKIEKGLLVKLREKNIRFQEIEYTMLEGATNKEKNLNLSDRMLEVMKKNQIDYCFSFGSHLLAGELLMQYKWKLINFHPAILPMYPGRKSIDQAVAHGNTLLVGNTAHFIDEGMDTGKIIMQSVIPLQAFKNAGNDYNCILDLQIEMLNKLIKLLQEDRIRILDENVEIIGADYSKYYIFPSV